MDTKSAAASNPTVDSGPRNTTSDLASEPKADEPRMIGDFDGSSNALWTLFKDEAKNHDDARIYGLKEDMGGALIFVRPYPICTYEGLCILIIRGLTGRFIFCCPHCFRNRQQTKLEAKPRRSNGVLPSAAFDYPLSDFLAAVFYRPTGFHPFHSTTSFPYIPSIGI